MLYYVVMTTELMTDTYGCVHFKKYW